ncbi:MAG: class I SAM-dependent methyltransferase [Sandaracinaceae bacterium]
MSPFLEHPIAYAVPERLTTHSAWKSHVPFGMVLTALLRPRSVVELGTQGGDSYCAFCQGIVGSGLEASAMAVDTWKGDAQTGFYGPEVLAGLRDHHDPRYGSFSRLIEARFEDARPAVVDRSVDLLHIDGQHGFDAVTRDWEAWKSTLSERGVLLLHDTEERGADFGVHRLFRSLAEAHPTFAFFHGHGLGVVGIGEALDGPVRALMEADEVGSRRVRRFFQRMGELTVARFDAETRALAMADAAAEVRHARDAQEAAQRAVAAERRSLEAEASAHQATRTEHEEDQRRRAALETQLEARTAEVARTAAALSHSESGRAALETELAEARAELRAAEERANAAEASSSEASETRDAALLDVTESRAAAEKERQRTAHAEAERDAARADSDAAREAARDARQRLDALTREVQGLRIERDALRAERGEWTTSMRRMRGLEQELMLVREDQIRVEHSVGFRAITLQRRLVDRLLPHGTRRREPYLRATTTLGRWLARPTPAPTPAPPATTPAPEATVRTRPPLIERGFSPIEARVSVVIPTKNGEDEGFARGLRAFRQQEGLTHPIELIVVDSASHDGTQSIARRAGATLHVIDPDRFDHGATRNLGASLATGELLLFSVQDAVPGHPTLVQEMADMLLSGDLAVVSAKQLTRADADPYCAFTLFNHYRALGNQTRITAPGSQNALEAASGEARWKLAYVDDVCALHQRGVFDRLQYRPMPYGEDLEYGIRAVAAGHGLGFYADGGVVHSHLRSAAYQLRTHYVVRRDLGPLLAPGRLAVKTPLGALIAAGRRAFLALEGLAPADDPLPPGAGVKSCLQRLRDAGHRPPASSGDTELDQLLEALAGVAAERPDLTLFSAMAGTLETLAVPFLEAAYPTLRRDAVEDFVRKSLSATLGAALGDWAARHPNTDEAHRLREVLA